MTETTLLDECAISKIEARIAKRDDTSALESACGEYNCSCHYDLPALCATVKHLRGQVEDWSAWHVKEPGPCGHHPCHQYDLRTIAGNPDAAHGCASCEVIQLQSQLEQLRAENEALRKHVDDLNHDLCAVKECNEHHG